MRRIITYLVLFLIVMSSYAQKRDTLHNMTKKGITLDEVVITGNNTNRAVQMKSSSNLVSISKAYLNANFSGSLMQSLSNIPGVEAMSIGAGQSKPAIRGLGFNRMVVTENGIKHEGQQWGEEHGLEIDQYAVDRVEVIKGPAALLYGSDAIGGVINLYSNNIPTNRFEGKINTFAHSNNESIGLSAQIGGRNKRFYYKLNTTLIDFADYKVPADSIQYYSYYIKLKDRRLRNTAGKEYDGSFNLGYIGEKVSTDFRVSNIYEKSGFFADAHGLEVRLSQIDYDKSRRDIDLPYHQVDHFKAVNRTTWMIGNSNWETNLSFQNNYRRELSEPISHGYMPVPPNSLEREYKKQTYTGNLGMKLPIANKHMINAGLNSEYQHNRRGGWGFIIPDFETTSLGAYLFDRYSINDDLIVNAGVRYDWVKTNIHSYNDWYKTPVAGSDSVYKQRSTDMQRTFNSFTWSMGINYNVNNWILKTNVGKSFRVPIAKELGADGVNYNIFRYEKGEANLSPEESYQFDAGINWNNGIFNFQLDPYVNYFPNYIYLNPTSYYTEGLQTYYYTQSKVFRYGFEAQMSYSLRHFEFGLTGEYLHAEQLSGDKKGYGLPFSPPWAATAEIKYKLTANSGSDNDFISLSYKRVGTQNEIVPPELVTKGYGIFNANIAKSFAWKERQLNINLQASNLLNNRYYDHTSFYRLIDVPEPGRNISLMIGLEF